MKENNNRQNKISFGLKLYIVLISIVAVLAAAAFLIVFFHAGYNDKILVQSGIKEQSSESNWAVKGWNNTLEKINYDSDIVFFGDSITYGSSFGDYFPDKKIVNLGYPGDDLSGMINRVSMIKAVLPEKIFIMGGINGISDNNIDKCIQKYSVLLDSIKQAVPDSEIYIQSVLPISYSRESKSRHNTTIIEFNNKLKKLADERGLTYIDLHSLYVSNGEMDASLTKDGLHLYPQAYKRWADAIRKYID